MRYTIKFVAASIGLVIAFLVGSVAFAQPASATFCLPIHAASARADTTTATAVDADQVDPVVEGTPEARLLLEPLPDPPEPWLMICGPVIVIRTNR
jgi:hypothetical protein